MPTIVPFTFGEDEINLDETVTATCTITKGDLPLSIYWTFSEESTQFSYNLSSNDGIIISRSSQKISMLAIDAVKARHRGNYTCVASNKGGAAQHSTYLRINGELCYYSSKFFILKTSMSNYNFVRILQFVYHLKFEICFIEY